MTDRLQPEAKIYEILFDVTGHSVADIKPEQKLGDDLGLDSLDILTIGSELEKHYGFVIPDAEIENVQTVNDIIQLVVKKLNPID